MTTGEYPQGGPTGGWGAGAAPPYPGGGQAPPVSYGAGFATASLVLGIIALVFCWTVFAGILLGILAVIFGVIAVRRSRRHAAPGHGRAVAGLITGGLGLVLAIVLVAVGLSILHSSSVTKLQHCLNQAGNNASAQQVCDQRFQKNFHP